MLFNVSMNKFRYYFFDEMKYSFMSGISFEDVGFSFDVKTQNYSVSPEFFAEFCGVNKLDSQFVYSNPFCLLHFLLMFYISFRNTGYRNEAAEACFNDFFKECCFEENGKLSIVYPSKKENSFFSFKVSNYLLILGLFAVFFSFYFKYF